MHTKEDFLNVVLPYRMKAIDVFRIALSKVIGWKSSPEMEVYFDGKLSIRGRSTAWTNPVIEAGIIHCRALLEFLGLREDPENPFKLTNRKKKRDDDFGVEDYGRPLITVEEALKPYDGAKEEAEKALASTIHVANKGMAHTTSGQIFVDDDIHLYEIASRGVPTLIINHLFVPLGIKPPDYKVLSTLTEEPS